MNTLWGGRVGGTIQGSIKTLTLSSVGGSEGSVEPSMSKRSSSVSGEMD